MKEAHNTLNCDLLVQEFELDESSEEAVLLLSFRIKCDYQVEVRSPKLAILFSDGDQDRRFPVSIRSYYPEADFKQCVIFASARVRLPYLFTKPFSGNSIRIQFELIYGEETVFPVPFQIRSDVHPQLEDFSVGFEPEKQQILFKPLHQEKPVEPRGVKNVIRGVFHWIHRILLTVLSILLLPWFVVDALFALAGCAQKAPNVKPEHSAKMRFLMQIKYGYQGLWHRKLGRDSIIEVTNGLYRLICFFCPVKKNRVAFMSSRRGDLTGNPEFVYQELKKDPNLQFRFLMKADPFFHMRLGNILRFLYLYATSSVVMVDDFFQLLNYVEKRPQVRLIQLWHACGAFKTFGFSRIEKPGGPKQNSMNHRQYDYSIVSSQEIAKFYAEGFGVPQSHIAATGIPRTDIFMDAAYADRVRRSLYEKYPALEGKKIVLFAPTFRGNGQKTAYYPLHRFHPEKIVEESGGEYAVILKLHPFCRERFEIPEEYRDSIFDFSEESELNDLLFITDLLITDYSSAVFEASLLNIPMLLYAFDLREYISQRDFYYEYESFVPGKIAFTESQMLRAIRNGDFQTEKIEPFCRRFFDERDGHSTQRVANLVRSLLAAK